MISLTSCDTNSHRASHNSDIRTMASKTDTVNSQPISANGAIGPLHWDITGDEYSTVSDKWIKDMTDTAGHTRLGGMNIDIGGISPDFSIENLLTGLKIEFESFQIHTIKNKDTQKGYKAYNEKIAVLIQTLNCAYGTPRRIDFNQNDINIYSSSQTKVIAQWQKGNTVTTLNMMNNATDDKYVYCTEIRLKIKKN